MQQILTVEMEREIKKHAEEEAVRSQLKLDVYYFDEEINELHVTIPVRCFRSNAPTVSSHLCI